MQKEILCLQVLFLPGFLALLCGDPGQVENGWRVGSNFNIGQTVIYHCDEGHDLVGDGVLTCGYNWRWSNPLPECVPVECNRLEAPINGHVIGYGRTYGTRLQIRCDTGYKAVGSSERQCEADQRWSGRKTMCKEIDCGWPTDFWNGYALGHRTTVGSTITYVCSSGVSFNSGVTAVCRDDGTWSRTPPACYAHCHVSAIPDAIIFGGREGVKAAHGTILRFHCNGNLTLNDTSPVMCNNGSWTHTPSCVPISCHQPPPQISNGMRVFIGQRHGDRARYICAVGHQTREYNGIDLDIRCLFGEWVGKTPLCEPNYCSNPGSIQNGRIYILGKHGKFEVKAYISTFLHGYRLQFVCDYSYEIRGSSGATCVNGQWRPGIDTVWKCIKSIHPVFPKLWYPIEEKFASS